MACGCNVECVGIVTHKGLANLDETLYNTWQSDYGTPMVLIGHKMEYAPHDCSIDGGPGAFVAEDILERGFSAWYGAPGYYVDAPGVDRVIPNQYVRFGDYQPLVMSRVGSGGNPWDWIYGTIGSYGHDVGVGVRDWGDQSGEMSLS